MHACCLNIQSHSRRGGRAPPGRGAHAARRGGFRAGARGRGCSASGFPEKVCVRSSQAGTHLDPGREQAEDVAHKPPCARLQDRLFGGGRPPLVHLMGGRRPSAGRRTETANVFSRSERQRLRLELVHRNRPGTRPRLAVASAIRKQGVKRFHHPAFIRVNRWFTLSESASRYGVSNSTISSLATSNRRPHRLMRRSPKPW